MIYINTLFGKKEFKRIEDAKSFLGRDYDKLSRKEKDALSYLITNDQVKFTYGFLQKEEFLREIRIQAEQRPTSFDDMATLSKPKILSEYDVDQTIIRDIKYRIDNVSRRNMKRLLENGMQGNGITANQSQLSISSSPSLNRQAAFLGFAKLSKHLLQQHGKSSLFVCLGRSPTPIAAWLSANTPMMCILPFSSARLDQLSKESIGEARKHTKAHFDHMIAPYLKKGLKQIVLIDYSTSGESIFTVYNLLSDYLKQSKIDTPVQGVSLWRCEKTKKAASDSSRWPQFESFTKSNGQYQLSWYQKWFDQTAFMQHVYVKELIDDLGGFYDYNWPKEYREEIFNSMMNLLDYESFDVKSPYHKTPVLRDVRAGAYMDNDGYKDFILLRDEMLKTEADYDHFKSTIDQISQAPSIFMLASTSLRSSKLDHNSTSSI